MVSRMHFLTGEGVLKNPSGEDGRLQIRCSGDMVGEAMELEFKDLTERDSGWKLSEVRGCGGLEKEAMGALSAGRKGKGGWEDYI